MLIANLDFTTKKMAKKTFGKSKYWYKKGLTNAAYIDKIQIKNEEKK